MSTVVSTTRGAPGRVAARNAAWLAAGEVFSRLIGFAATIYLARRLGVEGYGLIGFAVAVLMYAAAIADAGLEHTGPQEVAHAPNVQAPLLWSLLISRALWSIIVASAVSIGALALFSGVERSVLVLFALTLLPLGANVRWFHVGLERTAIVAASRVATEAVRVLIILLLVRGPDDLTIVPLAQVAGEAVAAVLLVAGLRQQGIALSFTIDPGLARAVLRRSAPMAMSALLALMVYSAGLLFLRLFRDPLEVGLYVAGYTLLNLLGPLGHASALSLVPAMTRLRAAPGALRTLYADSIARAFAIGIPIAVGGWAVAPLLIDLVFGDAYATSAGVLAIVIWSMPVVLVRSVLQAAVIAHGSQQYALRATVAAALSNVVLNVVAVPLFGMHGAALATVAAETVRMAVTLVYVRQLGFPPTATVRFARSGVAAVGMGALLLVLRPATLWAALPLGVIAYVVALTLAGGLRFRRFSVAVTV